MGRRLGRRSPVHLPMYVQEVALPRGPWASLSEEKFRRGRVEGHTTIPVATFGLKLSVYPFYPHFTICLKFLLPSAITSAGLSDFLVALPKSSFPAFLSSC